MDDVLMSKCFVGHNECIDILIRVILGRDDLTIQSSEIQKNIKGIGRGIVLPEVYVIFITEHDVLKCGLPMYTIERIIQETGTSFNDRTHIIYVNGEHRDVNTALGRLVHDLFCRRVGEVYHEELAARLRHFKEDKSTMADMNDTWASMLEVEAEKVAEK